MASPGYRGVDGELKNLIFAANGPKPKIVLTDAINNTIDIVENAEYCLVYDRPLAQNGVTLRELVNWWSSQQGKTFASERDAGLDLYERLRASMNGNGAEQFLFSEYCKRYGTDGFDQPALIPQVYLHYDPYTRRAGATLLRQRMDFLLLLPARRRVVVELDGLQHYARADPRRHARMVAADRGTAARRVRATPFRRPRVSPTARQHPRYSPLLHRPHLTPRGRHAPCSNLSGWAGVRACYRGPPGHGRRRVVGHRLHLRIRQEYETERSAISMRILQCRR